MDDIIDLLQIKIERAKAQLPSEVLNAINAVDWKSVIIKMREEKGYNFEQIDALELETELALCGLLNPKDYPKELKSRMGISQMQTDELVKEMNEKVFAKIKEELIKNTERQKSFAGKMPMPLPHPTPLLKGEGENTSGAEEVKNAQAFSAHGIEIIGVKNDLPVPEKLEIPSAPTTPSILSQKLSGPVSNPPVKTEHSPENLTSSKPAKDPYREIPE